MLGMLLPVCAAPAWGPETLCRCKGVSLGSLVLRAALPWALLNLPRGYPALRSLNAALGRADL